jgi:hypothetical protein
MGFVWHYYTEPFDNTNFNKEIEDIFGVFFGGKE